MRDSGKPWPSLAVAVAALGLIAAPAARAQDAVAAGARIAAHGKGHRVPACAPCHGLNGMGDPSGPFPRLAGLSAPYMQTQLNAFASGERADATMGPIAKALAPENRTELALYYSAASAPYPPQASPNPALADKGRLLATLGSEEKKIPACTSCHGAFGVSRNPAIPTLAGQYAAYIVGELDLFRSGSRKQGGDQMQALAHAMTEDDARAAAAYFRQARLPGAAAEAAAIESGDPLMGK